jgi:2-phospho-L-lactate guanylyltransferase
VACHAIIAVRPAGEGKSRLAETLSNEERISLNYKFFRHVFSVAKEVFPADEIIVVSRSGEFLDEARRGGAYAHLESSHDLNAALAEGARVAVERGATELLSLSSDLPFLRADDLRAMLASSGDVVIATDRQRIGTNALLMQRPFAIPFLYGEASLSAHLAAAEQAGLVATVIDRLGLARDIDTPADLAELRH